jgi:hypothetical protein
MFRCGRFLTILLWGILNLVGASSVTQAQVDYSLSISRSVLADPGEQGVRLYFIFTSIDSVAGFDMLVKFNTELLTPTTVQPTCPFQVFNYDLSSPGQVRIVGRRGISDSVFFSPLPPGQDTLGYILVSITPQDLLIDIETPVEFKEDPITPNSDNRLMRSDGSFIEGSDLELTNGSVFIRHPLYGDVNDDGYPNTIADAIFLLNYLSGRQELTPRQKANSDLNRDAVQASMADFMNLVAIITEN